MLLFFSFLDQNYLNPYILDTKINNWKSKLVKIYFYVCEEYEQSLQYQCQRFTNNNKPVFTDQEAMTIYLFAIYHMKITEKKNIHKYAQDHLLSWFPDLPSYQAFNARINRLSQSFAALTEHLTTEFLPEDCLEDQSLLDSMPIILCSGKRKAKVAREISDKGYCSTKSFYFYGLKLHALAFRRIGKLPHPEQILLSSASVNDLSFYKENWATIQRRIFFGDKIYQHEDFF